MKRANKQNPGRKVSRRQAKAASPQRRRLLMEGLEQRQLLAANSIVEGLNPSQLLRLSQTAEFVSPEARQEFMSQYGTQINQARFDGPISPGGTGVLTGGLNGGIGGYGTGTGGAFSAVAATEVEPNNTAQSSTPINLGTGAGQNPAVDISGSLSLNTAGTIVDADYFRFNLRGGDIFNARALGGATDLSFMEVSASGGAGVEHAGNDVPLGTLAPGSPLWVDGNASIALVVPHDGEYVLRVGTTATNTALTSLYTVNVQTFRPVLESQEIGTMQTIFLDFDGTVIDLNELDLGVGTTRIPSFEQSLGVLGFQNSSVDRLIDLIIEEMEENYADLGARGNNGDYASTGNPGDYGIRILNSRDDADPWGLPNVSRVIFGGADITALGALGYSASVDIGNFITEETVVVFPDEFAGIEGTVGLPGPNASLVDLYGYAMGLVASHEVGHILGAYHQDNTNTTFTIMDTGGNPGQFGAGLDGLYGTEDDLDIDFGNDYIDSTGASAMFYGRFDSLNALAFSLSTGTVGGAITGTVFSDTNRSGTRNNNEAGLAGATVFLDLDADGIRDSNEPSAVTSATGTYSLAAGSGTYQVRALLPAGYTGTTTNPVTVTLSTGGSAQANFGMARVQADATGFKWSDNNGNGLFDTGEPGISGVYVYLDLDGDNRLDLGEPKAVTDASGAYSLNFPGPGTYTIREVVAAGYRQTFPGAASDFEHVVTYSGGLLGDNYNFGNQPVQDFGDAPAPFPTTGATAAVHGLVSGLSLGATVDTESVGQPTVGADGDDNNGDDEDGVRLISPLSPGNTGTLEVSYTNTTGTTAYLSAWLDINGDNDWTDVGEKIISDRPINTTGSFQLDVALPSTAAIGNTYARFRISQTPGIGITGFAAGGEVEDHLITIAASPELANNDQYDIPRGAIAVPLDILSNDFDVASDPLRIVAINRNGTLGQVQLAQDERSVFYTPRNNTLGPDSFEYTVENASGTLTGTATVDLNVIFQSEVPIAVDDSFNLPQGSPLQPINVLANDIPSIAGGLRVVATSSPDEGGTVIIQAGGQSLRYSPAAGFAGTETFRYTVSDALGNTSEAVATIHLQPGSQTDDIAAFIVETFANDGVTPINTIPAGQLFKVRVSVDDLRDLVGIQRPGLGAAYLDLLYTDGLVANIPGLAQSGFSAFNVEFGPLFTTVQRGEATIPGLFDEIGATQANPNTSFTGKAELFTITMLAVSPGIAEFVADPANTTFSDVVLINPTDQELTVPEINFGRRQLTIVPSGSDFTYAVDDSYPDQIDSVGNPIAAGSPAVLRVLDNDNFGPTNDVEIVNIGAAANGSPIINNNNTPNNTNDDFIVYTPDPGFVGVDQFTYTILSGEGVQSTAQVTVTVGNAGANDLVDIQVYIVDSDGNRLGPNDTLSVSEPFTLEVWVDDLRPPFLGQARGVFAAYTDLIFNSALAETVNTTASRFGFDVVFGDKFDPNPAVGDNYVPGLINEFGTIQTTDRGQGDPLETEPVLLASISMIATAPGNFRVTADPADVTPFQDTLLFNPPDPVGIDEIHYNIAEVRIVSGGGSGEGESPNQNLFNRWDVNADGHVSPIDALLVLNRLNRGGEGEAASTTSSGKAVYWDVNGDRRMSPIDVLQVINYLNRGDSASGEGEAAAPANSQVDYANAVDSVFSSLDDDDEEAGWTL